MHHEVIQRRPQEYDQEERCPHGSQERIVMPFPIRQLGLDRSFICLPCCSDHKHACCQCTECTDHTRGGEGTERSRLHDRHAIVVEERLTRTRIRLGTENTTWNMYDMRLPHMHVPQPLGTCVPPLCVLLCCVVSYHIECDSGDHDMYHGCSEIDVCELTNLRTESLTHRT